MLIVTKSALTVNLISNTRTCIYTCIYKRNKIVPDSFTEFSDNASQGKERLVDGATFPESVPRVLTRLL